MQDLKWNALISCCITAALYASAVLAESCHLYALYDITFALMIAGWILLLPFKTANFSWIVSTAIILFGTFAFYTMVVHVVRAWSRKAKA
jgi:hypothetical protein